MQCSLPLSQQSTSAFRYYSNGLSAFHVRCCPRALTFREMASALQQQLGNVRQAVRAPQSTVFKGKVSLLFNAREAAEIDLQSIYGLASKGNGRHHACPCAARECLSCADSR